MHFHITGLNNTQKWWVPFSLLSQAHLYRVLLLTCSFIEKEAELDGWLNCTFRRGNPLFLNEEMLNNLKRIWYSQSIAETVSRQLSKANARLQVFDWNEM